MRRLVIAVLATAALAFTAGCGGGSSSDEDGVATVGGSATPSSSASTDPDQGRKFAQCMRDNGVPDFPDPGPDGQIITEGFDRERLTSSDGMKALQACRDLAPNGGERAKLDPARQEQLREWAACMRENGIDMPDPNPNTGGFLGLGGELPFDPDDPKFKAAMEACQDKFTFRGQR